jgi:chemotaxis protein CheC
MQGWLSASAEISIDSADECPLEMATAVLGQSGDIVGMCLMQMEGTLNGQMVLAFDDASGLSLSDLLLGNSPGTATEWGNVEISSAQESMNILGSAYLNGMSRFLSEGCGESVSLIPSPPIFFRDFAESLLQTVFMEQASSGNHVLFARARFELHACPLNWTFLLIPDPPSLAKLSGILSKLGARGEAVL